MADTAPAGSKAAGWGIGLLVLAAGIIAIPFAIIVAVKMINAEVRNKPFELAIFKGVTDPTPPPAYNAPAAPGSTYGVPQTNVNCTPAQGARQVENRVCRRGPSDIQVSWNGRHDWCLGPKPSPQHSVCFNQQTRVLAWGR